MSSESCPICLTALAEQPQKTLTCDSRHVFHEICVDLWLSTRSGCPLCRETVPISLLPSWKAGFRYLCNRPVPEHLASEAYELCLTGINFYDDDFNVGEIFFGILHLRGDVCVIIAQNDREWLPTDWIEAAEDEDDEEQIELYNWISKADETIVITVDMGPPEHCKRCNVCEKFVTNYDKALMAHYLEKHSDHDFYSVNNVLKTLLQLAQ